MRRPIEELVGKGINISVEELKAEIDERQEFLDDTIPPILTYEVGYEDIPPISPEVRTKVINEIAMLDMEIAWRDRTPDSSETDIDPEWASAFIVGHEFGVKFERRQHQVNAVNKRHETNKEARIHCIIKASELWEGDPTARIGEIVVALTYDLKANDLYCPKPNTIRKWIKKAEKEGELTIPPEASKAGAPHTAK